MPSDAISANAALAALIAATGQRLGLGPLAFGVDGGVALRMEHRLVVNLQYAPAREALWLYADLGAPAAGESVYGTLLRGNFFWQATLGATLSLTGDDPAHVLLSLPVRWPDLTADMLIEHLEIFFNTASDWAELISDPHFGKDTEEDETPNLTIHL